MQCNLTKFTTLIANEFIIDITLISGIMLIFARYCAKSETVDITLTRAQ